MVKLDATTMAADGTTVPAVRRLTIPLPESCETTVTLLASLGDDKLWRSGVCVVRGYDTAPHPRECHDLPDLPDDDNGFCSLGAAIDDAAGRASYWLDTCSPDGDDRSVEASDHVEAWRMEFDEEWANESIFDAEEDAAPEPPAVEPQQAEAVQPSSSPMPIGTAVSDDAQRDFDTRKHHIEEQIGKLAIEQARLKLAIKGNREALAEYTEDLDRLLAGGPERHPLFDRPVTQATELTAPEVPPAAAEPEQQPTPLAGPEQWRSVSIEEVGIPAGLCKVLREEHEMKTIGDIADWTSAGNALTDLKKIGEAKAQKIEQAMDAYWAKHT